MGISKYRPTFSKAALLRFGEVLFGYMALAGLGIAVISGDQYASPIFPAAGLAIAAVLTYRAAVLPAIFLGSCFINILNGLLHEQSIALSTLLATTVGLGAALQAYVALKLIEHMLGDRWRLLKDEKDAVHVVVWGGLFSSVVSASVGNLALYLAGVVTLDAVGDSWLTWYIGDALGVCVATPMLLVIGSPRDVVKRSRLRILVLPTLLGALVSLSGMQIVRSFETTANLRHLNKTSEVIAQRINDRLSSRFASHREELTKLRLFAETKKNFTENEFSAFARTLLDANPDLFALSINDRVQGLDRQAYEARVKPLSVAADFSIKHRIDGTMQTAEQRPEYIPVRLIAPLEGNHQALGFDIFSEPIRRDAIERAISTQAFTITAPIRLVQEEQNRIGILALMPFFTRASKTGKSKVAGFAVAVIKVDNMLHLEDFSADDQHPVFQITDPLANSKGQLLFRSDTSINDFVVLPEEKSVWSRELPVADRLWQLNVYLPEGSVTAGGVPASWWVGLVGFFLCGIYQVMMFGISGRSEQLRIAHDEMRRLAFYDPLTGVANRSLFFEKLDTAIANYDRDSQPLALLYIDLDFFKEVNDRHGHSVGDDVLCEATKRLQRATRATDIVARLGGDEFAIMLRLVGSFDNAKSIAEKVLAELNQPFHMNGQQIPIGGCIGLALFPDKGEDRSSLILAADQAMYKAKAEGRGQLRIA
jgi:diguanylate cyclase